MRASWKTRIAVLLFCSQMVQVSAAEIQGGNFHEVYRVADMTQLLNRDTAWIHVGTKALPPVPDALENPPTHQQQPAASDETATTEGNDMAVTVADLFSSLRDVRATGPSSHPPELPNDADVESLTLPDNLAGSYAELSFARCYATIGYGVRRAPRNTHGFFSHPLYYEDANLERCGRSRGCLTTAWSALHFTSRAAITPYLLTLDHPDSCVATLPDCPACHHFDCDATFPRWSLKAAVVQGAAVTGLLYAIP